MCNILQLNNNHKFGNDIIDKQHTKIVYCINKLHKCYIASKKRIELIEVVVELYDISLEHFKTEEALMIKYNYPYYTYHQKDHSILINKLTEYKNEFINNKKSYINIAFILFLRNWFNSHTITSDIKFKNYYQKKKKEEQKHANV